MVTERHSHNQLLYSPYMPYRAYLGQSTSWFLLRNNDPRQANHATPCSVQPRHVKPLSLPPLVVVLSPYHPRATLHAPLPSSRLPSPLLPLPSSLSPLPFSPSPSRPLAFPRPRSPCVKSKI